jgi:hypothetical protein
MHDEKEDQSERDDWLDDGHTQHVLGKLRKRLTQARQRLDSLAASGTLDAIRLAKGKCMGLGVALQIMEGKPDVDVAEDQA